MKWDSFTFIDLEALTNPEILQRGIDFYQQRRLSRLCRMGDHLAGIVIGNGAHYRVRLWLNQRSIEGDCTCLYQGFCKHLVTLAMGWLNERSQFTNLQPILDQVLQDPNLLPTLIKTLIAQDPVNFLELCFAEKAAGKFETTRELTNLVRGVFLTTPLYPLDLDALGERLNRIEQLLQDRIAAADPEALPPLNDLITALAAQVGETKNSGFNIYFEKILTLAGALPERYDLNQLRPILITLLKSYFEPGLWEQKAAIGLVLDRFETLASPFIQEFLEEKIKELPDLFTFIGIYERLAPKTFTANSGKNELYQETLDALTASSEGRLWLIDRLCETKPDQAFQLARTSLRLGLAPKASFRDRLITLHHKRGEPRQAASLSFIQFQEEPNFNEYLRLKNILKDDPKEFEGYLRRIERFLQERTNRSLLLHIAVDQRDYERFQAQFVSFKDDLDSLLLIAETLLQNPSAEWLEIYPEIIRPLLSEPGPKFRQTVLQLISAFKKACYKGNRKATWETFRQELLEEYGEDPWFRRKYGSMLRE